MVVNVSSINYFFGIFICFSCLLYPSFTLADSGNELNSSILIEMGSDEDGEKNYLLSADTMLDDNHQVYFSYAEQNSSDTGPVSNTKNYSLGIEEQADTDFNSGFAIDRWGNDKILTTQSLNATLRYNLENFTFSVSPVIQRIRFVDTIISNASRSFDVNGDGWRASLSYFSPNNWYMLLRRSETNFYLEGSGIVIFLAALKEKEENITDPILLARIRLYRAFVFSAFDSAPLDIYRNSITLGTSIDIVDVSLDVSRSESLIGNKTTTVKSLSTGLPLSETILLHGQLGETSTDDQPNLVFGSLGVTLRW